MLRDIESVINVEDTKKSKEKWYTSPKYNIMNEKNPCFINY